MNNELKQLRRHRTCTRIALVWSCGWLLASCLMLADLARAQSIYLDYSYGTVDAAMVNEASWIFRERFGMGMDTAGATTTGCGSNRISVRYASIVEWAAANPPSSSAYAFAAYCDNPQQMQVIWSPFTPMHVNGLRHEFGHAAGCYRHLPFFASNVMHSAGSAQFLTVSDMECVLAGAFWPVGVIDKCFVEVAPNLDMYIPSIAGLQVWLTYQGAMQWTLAASRATSLSCPGNALSGPVATFDDVRGYGLVPLSFVRLRNTGGTTWTLEAAR